MIEQEQQELEEQEEEGDREKQNATELAEEASDRIKAKEFWFLV